MTRRYQNILLLNASATGAGTAITGDDRETSTAIFAVTITGTATITFQGSADGGVTTYSIPVTSVTASPVTSTTVTASGIYRCDATGISVFPNVTSYSSGAVTVVGSLERGTLAGGIASGGGGGGGAITMASGAVASGAYVSGSIADGAIVTIGTEADTANTTASTSGTLMAFLKGAVKVLADVWNGTLHYLNVAVTDGTHLLPTMDAAARAGYVIPTDGTHTMPTADALTRPLFTRLTDTTTNVGVDATSTGLKVAFAADLTAAATTPLPVSSWDQTLTYQQTIKPASTAIAATDIPAAVGLHPSSPTPAGTNHMGSISGHSIEIRPTVTVTASAYTANNNVGGLITLVPGRAANLYVTLEDIEIADHANNTSATYDIIFFKTTPAATFTDKSAFPTLSAADLALICGRVSLATTDGKSVGGALIYAPTFQPKVMLTDGSSQLYMAINASVAPTFANTTDFKIKLGFFQD